MPNTKRQGKECRAPALFIASNSMLTSSGAYASTTDDCAAKQKL
jgi:hypothetical protein